MKFLLDTDHISILQKQAGPEYPVLMAHIAQVRRADLAFCIISFHE
jgi:tRNA(fMet)-specific endonuclease VapC